VIYVNVTDWEGVKGNYEVKEVDEKNIGGMVRVTFINSIGDIERMLVHRSALKQKAT